MAAREGGHEEREAADDEHVERNVLDLVPQVQQKLEDAGADENANHEAGEHPAVVHLLDRGRLERGSPHEDKDVHGTLEEALAHSQHPNALVGLKLLPRVADGLGHVQAEVARVLAPVGGDDEAGDYEEQQGGVERGDRPEGLTNNAGKDTGGDGDDAVARCADGESEGKPLVGVVGLLGAKVS